MKRAAFLDRDGVINIDHAYVYKVEDFEWIDNVLEASRTLYEAGFALVVVTNQSGIGRGYYSEKDFSALCLWMEEMFLHAGAPLAGIYHCPHHPQKALAQYKQSCHCRKPAPGMLLRAAKELDLDLTSSVIFGDKVSDMEAGLAAGLPERVLLGTNGLIQPPPITPSTRTFDNLQSAVTAPWFKDFLRDKK